MPGIIVTWDEDEIQTIDEGNFEETVVEVVDEFFGAVGTHREVTVEWRTANRDHDTLYKVERQPLMHLDRSRCFIDIKGQSRGGQYQIDLQPSGFFIKVKSSGQREELTFLRLRDDGLGINVEEEEVYLESIPERIKKRIVQFVE